MADVKKYTNQIAKAQKGRDVRDAIVNAINEVSDENNEYNQVKADILSAQSDIAEKVTKNEQTAQTFAVDVKKAEELKQGLDTDITQGTALKSQLDAAVETADTSKKNLDASNTTAGQTKTALDGSVSNAQTLKQSLDSDITQGTTLKTDLESDITQGTALKSQLDAAVETADTSKKNLDASNTVAGKTKTALDVSNTTATKTKTDLDASNATASETKTGLDATNKTAADLVASLGDKITEGTQVKTDIQTTGETAMSNLQAEAAKQQEYIKTSIDDTLSISGKAADASVTGKKIDSLKEDLSNKITKFYASNQGETHITDSDNGKIQDMMIYGKSSQDGTPTPENPVKIKSVVNPTVKVCGNNFYSGSDLIGLTKAYTTDFMPVILHKKKFYISFDAFSDTSNGKYLISVEYFDANKENIGSNGKADLVGNNISHINFWFDESTTGNNKALDFKNVLYVKVKFYIYANTATEITYKNIMVSATDSDFEPYKSIQTVTLPYTLNAIPVKSGGNVTIDGQQYIADYVDVEHGKVIRNILKWRLGDFKYGFNNAVWHINISELGIDGSKIGLSNMFKIQSGNYNGVTASEFYIAYDGKAASLNMRGMTDEEFKKWLREKNPEVYNVLTVAEEIPITLEEASAFKQLMTYYPVTNISVNSEQLDGLTVFNYPISMANGWNYVKQQLNDNRDYIYDMDLQSAEAYVNSEYAVALTELEV